METKASYDAGDEGQVEKRKTKFQIKKEQDKEDLKRILDSAGGRRFLWKILSECRIYDISFTGDEWTAFNEGKRQIGLRLIEDIFNADSKAYLEMHLEGRFRKEARNG